MRKLILTIKVNLITLQMTFHLFNLFNSYSSNSINRNKLKYSTSFTTLIVLAFIYLNTCMEFVESNAVTMKQDKNEPINLTYDFLGSDDEKNNDLKEEENSKNSENENENESEKKIKSNPDSNVYGEANKDKIEKLNKKDSLKNEEIDEDEEVSKSNNNDKDKDKDLEKTDDDKIDKEDNLDNDNDKDLEKIDKEDDKIDKDKDNDKIDKEDEKSNKEKEDDNSNEKDKEDISECVKNCKSKSKSHHHIKHKSTKSDNSSSKSSTKSHNSSKKNHTKLKKNSTSNKSPSQSNNTENKISKLLTPKIHNSHSKSCNNGYVKINCNSPYENTFKQCDGAIEGTANHIFGNPFLDSLNSGLFGTIDSWSYDSDYEHDALIEGNDTVGLRWNKGKKQGCGTVSFDNGIKTPIVVVLQSTIGTYSAYYMRCPDDDQQKTGCYNTAGTVIRGDGKSESGYKGYDGYNNNEVCGPPLRSISIYTSDQSCSFSVCGRPECDTNGLIPVPMYLEEKSCSTSQLTYNNGREEKDSKACIGAFEGFCEANCGDSPVEEDDDINNQDVNYLFLPDILKDGYFCGLSDWEKVAKFDVDSDDFSSDSSNDIKEGNGFGFQIDLESDFSGTWSIDSPSDKDMVISLNTGKYWSAYYIPGGCGVTGGKWSINFMRTKGRNEGLTHATLWVSRD